MTDNYDQSAITQVPAEVSSNSKQDILNKFRSYDELYNAVRKLDVNDFIKRFASNNEKAGLDIYNGVLADIYKPEPIRSIYAERITSEQDPPDEHKNIDIRIVFACVILIVILFLWFKS